MVRITTGLCCNWGFVDFHFLISHLSRVECNIFAFRSRFILSKNLRQSLLIRRRLFSTIELIQMNKHFLSKITINLLIAKAQKLANYLSSTRTAYKNNVYTIRCIYDVCLRVSVELQLCLHVPI